MKTEHINPNRHSRTSLFNGFFEGQASLRVAASGNESGRSMVEMLGVLAVMGILTIGGIAGFNYAMDKSKANDILDGVNKRAIALSPLMLLGNDISNNALDAEFGTTIGDSGVALVADATGFDLTVNHVSKNVCDNVLNAGLKSASEIMLGNETIWNRGVKSDHTCADDNNEITFAFNTSLAGTRDSQAAEPTEPLDANGCPASKPVLATNGICRACPTTTVNYSANSADECAKCGGNYTYSAGQRQCVPVVCPAGYFNAEYHNGKMNCLKCDDPSWYYHAVGNITTANVRECVNTCSPYRSFMSDGYSSQSCVMPCENSNMVREGWGRCIDCNTATQYWDPDWGSCALCPGKDFRLNNYGDDCNLVSQCAEGTHFGNCCEPGEVWTQTGTSRYTGIAQGVCCPAGRPVWNGSMCVQQQNQNP